MQNILFYKMKDIAERIRKLMEDKGLTPTEFAKAIGENPSKISHLLSGRNNPSLALLSKIQSSFTNVNLHFLITGETIENKEVENLQNEKSKMKIPKPLLENPDPKAVEHITFFYQDGTFKTYRP